MRRSSIAFIKASACGNDFLVADANGVADLAGVTRRICDRHTGVGADGVEWTFPTQDADIAVRLFNADGSEAEISGNGTRCVAAHWASSRNLTHVRVKTVAGIRDCTLIDRSGLHYIFESTMGIPNIQSKLTITVSGREFRGLLVAIGNPHFVIFESLFPAQWQNYAGQIQQQPCFSEGVNVEFAVVRNRSEIDIRIFERGVGETQSSGTGSCASAVAAISAKLCESPVHVHTPGGTQNVRWDDEVFLTGPATLICSGEFFI
jgi:diaminopimelate epimerase